MEIFNRQRGCSVKEERIENTMNDDKIDVIAIDGPAGSGKSTTARLVAQKLGFTFLDTGAMYRALTLKALRKKIDLRNEVQVISLIRDTRIELIHSKGRLQVFLDHENVTRKIRNQSVTNHVSTVAAIPGVRQWLVRLQRGMGTGGKIVAEGRDIGTIVFPNARLKIFLAASLEERAKRRQKDFHQNGERNDLEKVIVELQARDHVDSARATGPLKKAEDAIELDTTNLTIEQQVNFIVEQWKRNAREFAADYF